ncbi:MAG: hypothetical protein HY288_04120 [Planctomycetia bacterium]|nr:hypothetical protein [Planctomycetia bacterium]
MPRYVILRHELPHSDVRGLHWDLMLESGAALRTWALDGEPISSAEIAAEQLPDHRLAYLDYEGAISGNRGFVTRWDAGDYRLENATQDEVKIVVRGTRLNGSLTLSRQPGETHSWRVSFFPVPTSG